MAKTLVIQPVTRIEGHAKVTIQLNDGGNADTARVNVIELRGFEKFCLGRPVEDLPRITPRICGVCPWSHHLASAKACDAVFGVEPPPAGKKLRELCNSIAYMEEHILHFYFLAGADFLLRPAAPYSTRNVFCRLRRHRQRRRRALPFRRRDSSRGPKWRLPGLPVRSLYGVRRRAHGIVELPEVPLCETVG